MIDANEWLHTDGSGAFAMGQSDRVPRRKYHGLWISRAFRENHPEHLLLDVFERVECSGRSIPLVNYDFGQGAGVDARDLISAFRPLPNPVWLYQLDSQTQLVRSFRFLRGKGIELSYELKGQIALDLSLHPLFTIRDIHQLSRETQDDSLGRRLKAFFLELDGPHRIETNWQWYRGFSYEEELKRGYPFIEDCICPIQLFFKLPPHKMIHFRILAQYPTDISKGCRGEGKAPILEEDNIPHSRFAASLSNALQSYVFQDRFNGNEERVIAGYPWFGAWARDTLLSLPGLSLAWNKFPGGAERGLRVLSHLVPDLEYFLFKNSAKRDLCEMNCSGLDTPFLWAWALNFLITEHPRRVNRAYPLVQEHLSTLEKWLLLFFRGNCEWVEVTDQGFFCKPGSYATSWMDACIQGEPVTPRQGYPIDINILFFESMRIVLDHLQNVKPETVQLFSSYLAQVEIGFGSRFWVNEGYIADGFFGVSLDGALRPNQLWALRSPLRFFHLDQMESAFNVLTEDLLTPYGLRTLSPRDSCYQGNYLGNQTQRDQAYHQGTVWPWLIGIYTESAVRIFGVKKAKAILTPVLDALEEHFQKDGCVGHISEIFDGDPPHLARGAPAQAWSSAETLRALWLLGDLKF